MGVQIDEGSKTLSRKKDKIKEPDDYTVVLLNDDYTTRDFVVEILKLVFHKNHDDAVRIMMNVHNKGRGAVGRYTYDIALTKTRQVHDYAERYEFPLRCVVEKI